MQLDVGEEVRIGEQLVDDAVAVMQPVRRLEQRRDLDVALDAEEPRIVERREQREGSVRLGDQQANRRAPVEVLAKLRREHEDAFRGGLLARHGAVVHVDRGDAVEKAGHRAQELPPRRALPGRGAQRDVGPDGVVQLHGVQAEVQPCES